MNQLWRRNIKKTAKNGVMVTASATPPTCRPSTAPTSRPPSATASRRGRSSYFQRMYAASWRPRTPTGSALYLAEHEGDVLAATILVRVGEHAWYSYGASTAAKREVQGSTAIQWRMMRDSIAAGADVYDLRGITDTVAEDDPHIGLIRFKVGTGGEAVELRRRVGPAAEPLAVQGFRPLHEAAVTQPCPSSCTSTVRAGAPPHDRFVADHPGLVPVIKGNGYGFGRDLLVRRVPPGSACVDDRCRHVCRGCRSRWPASLATCSSWSRTGRRSTPGCPTSPTGALVHTVTHGPDLASLAGWLGRRAGRRRGPDVDEPLRHPVAALRRPRAARAVRRRRRHPAPPARHRARRGDRALHRRRPRRPRVVRVARLTRPSWPLSQRVSPTTRSGPRIGTDSGTATRAPAARAHVLDVRHVSTAPGRLPAASGAAGGHLVVASGDRARCRDGGPTAADRCGHGPSPSPRARSRRPPGPVAVQGGRSHARGSPSRRTCSQPGRACPRAARRRRSATRSTCGSATPRCAPTASSSNDADINAGFHLSHGPVTAPA